MIKTNIRSHNEKLTVVVTIQMLLYSVCWELGILLISGKNEWHKIHFAAENTMRHLQGSVLKVRTWMVKSKIILPIPFAQDIDNDYC